jgi:hypothetical protein
MSQRESRISIKGLSLVLALLIGLPVQAGWDVLLRSQGSQLTPFCMSAEEGAPYLLTDGRTFPSPERESSWMFSFDGRGVKTIILDFTGEFECDTIKKPGNSPGSVECEKHKLRISYPEDTDLSASKATRQASLVARVTISDGMPAGGSGYLTPSAVVDAEQSPTSGYGIAVGSTDEGDCDTPDLNASCQYRIRFEFLEGAVPASGCGAIASDSEETTETAEDTPEEAEESETCFDDDTCDGAATPEVDDKIVFGTPPVKGTSPEPTSARHVVLVSGRRGGQGTCEPIQLYVSSGEEISIPNFATKLNDPCAPRVTLLSRGRGMVSFQPQLTERSDVISFADSYEELTANHSKNNVITAIQPEPVSVPAHLFIQDLAIQLREQPLSNSGASCDQDGNLVLAAGYEDAVGDWPAAHLRASHGFGVSCVDIKFFVEYYMPLGEKDFMAVVGRYVRAMDSIRYANSLFAQSMAGVYIDIVDIDFLGEESATDLEGGCQARFDLLGPRSRGFGPVGDTLYYSDRLNLYFVEGSGGVNCSTPSNVIFVRERPGAPMPLGLAAHELGHYLGLKPSRQGGHVNNGCDGGRCEGFAMDNIMYQTSRDPLALLRDHITIGQAYRMTMHETSGVHKHVPDGIAPSNCPPLDSAAIIGCPPITIDALKGELLDTKTAAVIAGTPHGLIDQDLKAASTANRDRALSYLGKTSPNKKAMALALARAYRLYNHQLNSLGGKMLEPLDSPTEESFVRLFLAP